MKREIFLPVYLGFLAKSSPYGLAEDDTVKGHVHNMTKWAKDHETVAIDVIETQDGKDENITNDNS